MKHCSMIFPPTIPKILIQYAFGKMRYIQFCLFLNMTFCETCLYLCDLNGYQVPFLVSFKLHTIHLYSGLLSLWRFLWRLKLCARSQKYSVKVITLSYHAEPLAKAVIREGQHYLWIYKAAHSSPLVSEYFSSALLPLEIKFTSVLQNVNFFS